MRLQILAIGRLKSGPEQALFERYVSRIKPTGRPFGITSVDVLERAESRLHSADARKTEEGEWLLSKCPTGAVRIALDERGNTLSSRDFAKCLARWTERGRPSVTFILGGPDGLAETVRQQADTVLSLGKMTFPHQIARALLAEQIYRAFSILANHPYHRD